MLIVCGAQHGLAVAATALLRPGDVVAVDALTYYGFKGVAEAQRLELAPVPVSAEGPDLDALERLCARAACAPSTACRRCTIRSGGCWTGLAASAWWPSRAAMT